MLAVNDYRVVLTFNLILFFTVHLLSHWQRKPCSTRKRVLACPPTCVPHKHLQPELVLVRESNSCVGCCVHAKVPLCNVARRSPLIFSIFLHHLSCTTVQSISETTSQKTYFSGHKDLKSEDCPTMPCNSLVLVIKI